MTFLITGLPRTRSAWFSALLDCQHDFSRDGRVYGDLCDPTVACVYPEMASQFDRVVVIERSPNESRRSFEAWANYRLTDEYWADCLRNYERLKAETKPLLAGFHHLTDDAVFEIASYVGKPQSMEKIQRFQRLRIEECLGAY